MNCAAFLSCVWHLRLGLVLLVFTTTGLNGADSSWLSPVNGDFHDGSKWSSGVPGATDHARFTIDGAYTISWTANAINANATLDRGAVTLAIGSAAWVINGNYLVGQLPGATGSVDHVSGMLVVTNAQGTAQLNTGQSRNRNYTLFGGTAIVDRFSYTDDGAAGYCKFFHYGTLTTRHGSSMLLGSDLVFFYLGGQTGVWNMDGGTNTILNSNNLDLYTTLGWAYDSRYIINVNGPGTLWTMDRHLRVGLTGGGHELNIRKGARVVSKSGTIGIFGSDNAVLVDGVNSSWFNLGGLGLSSAAGRLRISGGGRVTNTVGRVGGGNNLVEVLGAASVWDNGTNLLVGEEGTYNQVIVSGGGRINSQTVYLGGGASTFNPGTQSGNTALITGTNSFWNLNGGMRVGSFGPMNRLTIADGGRLNSSTGIVGANSECTNNEVEVTGPGSLWNMTGGISVGSFGAYSRLVLADGARINSQRLTIGSGSASNVVFVTDANSVWTVSSNIQVGFSAGSGPGGRNHLIISNSAVVTATNLIAGINSISPSNAITIAGGGLFITNAGANAVMDVRRATLTLHRGQVAADRLLVTNGLQSGLNLNGGRLTSRSTSISNQRVTVVGDGLHTASLNLMDGVHSFANGLSVAPVSALTASGIINGSVANSGTFAVNRPSGSVAINGDLQLGGPGALALKIGGADQSSQYDFIQVANAVQWGGSLRVTLINGFVPSAAQTFDVLQAGSATGVFDNVASGGRLKTTDRLGSFIVTYAGTTLQFSGYQTTDADGDGIEDAWALQFFGVTPLPGGSGPNSKFGDKDGDGLSNYAEFLAGTDPQDASSGLELTAALALDFSSVVVQFNCVSGRIYRVWRSADLIAWTEVALPTFAAPAPGVCQWLDYELPPPGGRRFYRVSVE